MNRSRQCSSRGPSNGFLNRVSGVRFTQRAPSKALTRANGGGEVGTEGNGPTGRWGGAPHQAIGDLTPAERYTGMDRVLASAAPQQSDMAEPTYPPHSILRKVHTVGTFGYRRRLRIVPRTKAATDARCSRPPGQRGRQGSEERTRRCHPSARDERLGSAFE